MSSNTQTSLSVLKYFSIKSQFLYNLQSAGRNRLSVYAMMQLHKHWLFLFLNYCIVSVRVIFIEIENQKKIGNSNLGL